KWTSLRTAGVISERCTCGAPTAKSGRNPRSIAEEEQQIDSEALHPPEQRFPGAHTGRVAAHSAQTQVARQLVLSEHLVIRIRAELSRVGQEQSLPNLAACRQSEGPRSS